MKLKLDETLFLETLASVMASYPSIPEDQFMSIISLDPTYIEGKDSVGKYGKWLLNLYNKGNLGNFGHVHDALTRFDTNKKYLKNKDIGQFKTIDALDVYLNDENNYNDQSARQKLRDTQKARHNADIETEAEHVFSGEGWDVYIPLTYAASCKLGNGTSWCTATTESDYYFNHYTGQGPLYILINKSNPEEKYQFHFETRSFMDKDDSSINIFDFLAEYSSMYDFFREIMLKAIDFDSLNIESDECSFTLTMEQLATKFRHEYDSRSWRDAVSGEFIADILFGDYFEYFGDRDTSISDLNYYLNLDLVTEYSWELLEQLGYSKDYIINLDDWNDLDEDVLNAFLFAYSDAEMAGSYEEAFNDIIKEIENCNIFDIDYDTSSSQFNFSMSLDDILRYTYDSSYYLEESGYGIISDLITLWFDDFKIYEPYNGWYDFDNDAFKDGLEYRLSELN